MLLPSIPYWQLYLALPALGELSREQVVNVLRSKLPVLGIHITPRPIQFRLLGMNPS